MNTNVEHVYSLTQEVWEIFLPDSIRYSIKEYIERELKEHNPYTSDESIMIPFAERVFLDLVDYTKKQSNLDAKRLISIINSANKGGNVPPMYIRNTPCDPIDTLLPAEKRLGYNYGGSEQDRMKKYFYAEWTAWLFATLLNYETSVHPSEHGGNNRFHLISPVKSEDDKLRNTGASTGGGIFYQHSDATVYTELKNQLDIEKRLLTFNSNLAVVSERLNKPVKQIVSEMTCCKFTRVDAMLLKGILNKQTETHIVTPQLLQSHLEENDFNKEEIMALSKMPIAHIAGPADGEISGYVGEINKIVNLNDEGNIISTCLNASENRMIYVGSDDIEKVLFERFLELLRSVQTYKFLLQSNDLLFIPNAAYGTQTNVTHGRGRLADDEYNIPIGENRFGRRMHCRQYVKSRSRDQKASLLANVLDKV